MHDQERITNLTKIDRTIFYGTEPLQDQHPYQAHRCHFKITYRKDQTHV